MQYICLFAPAFISLFLKYKAEENLKAKILNIICYYFIMVNIINLSVMIVAKLFFNNYSFEFTTSFSYSYSYDFNEKELTEIEQIDEAYNVRNIPFIIYAEGIESQEIDTLFNDIDVLPTILNLFGIEYDPRIYVGIDIFSEDHQNLIFLADYTWYDGNIYSGNYIEEATDEYIANNEYMMDRLNFNRMIISNNYYSYEE